LTEGERKVMQNLQRKSEAAARMFDALVAQMNNAISIDKKETIVNKMEVPAWL